MKKIFLVVLLLMHIITIQAQCSIVGKILDENKQGMAYATIQLLDKDLTFIQGTTTDSVGLFTMREIINGEYILIASSIGYQTTQRNITIQDKLQHVSPIILTTNNVMLGEVIIKASSFIRQKDHILIIPDKQQVKHAGTGYDLLYNMMIPNINVERSKGKVTTFGGDVTLYIDGRQVDYREIQSLRPKDIEKIEYHDVPTGKYSDDIAAINYITKKYKAGGYLALDGQQTIGYVNGNYNIIAKLSHKNTNLSLFGGYMMEKYNGIKSNNHEYFMFPKYTVIREYNTTEALTKNNKKYIQLNVSNHTKKRTLLGKLSFTNVDVPNNFVTDQIQYRQYYNMVQNSNSFTDQSNLKPNIELYGDFSLADNQKIETTLQGSFTKNNYNRDYTEGTFSAYTDTKEKLYELRGNVKYSLSFKRKNSLSAQLRYMHKISSVLYTGDRNTAQHLSTGQTVFSMQYTHRFGKKTNIQVAPGVSALQYRLQDNNRIYQVSPRLNLRLTYRPTIKQQFRMNVAIGNSHPNISRLNNMDQNVDFMTVIRGNPTLDITRFLSSDIGYNLQLGSINILSAGMCRYYKHISTDDYYIENDKLIHSFRSNSNAYEVMAILAGSWKATEHLHFKAEANWMRISIYGEDLSNALNTWSSTAQVNYYWKEFALSLYGKTSTRSMEINFIHHYQPANYGVTLNWNHRNWQIESGIENPLKKKNKHKYSLKTNAYNFNKTTTSQIFQQTGYIKIAYTFDFGHKTSREQNNVNTSINSAIMKAE